MSPRIFVLRGYFIWKLPCFLYFPPVVDPLPLLLSDHTHPVFVGALDVPNISFYKGKKVTTKSRGKCRRVAEQIQTMPMLRFLPVSLGNEQPTMLN